jgi:hypothetical protein
MTRFAIAAAFAFATLIAPAAPASAAPPSRPTSPVSQLPIVGTTVGGTFSNGTLNLSRFTVVNGVLMAVGTLTATVTNALTGQTATIMQTISMPVQSVTGTCDILHLDLGPLDLNLLGLQVNLSEVILDITAQTGSGNLLGNLLCAVTGLLDNPSGLSTLLNQILSAL